MCVDFFDKAKAASKMLAANMENLSLSLIIRNALCLGCARILGSKRQHQEHHNVRYDIIEING